MDFLSSLETGKDYLDLDFRSYTECSLLYHMATGCEGQAAECGGLNENSSHRKALGSVAHLKWSLKFQKPMSNQSPSPSPSPSLPSPHLPED